MTLDQNHESLYSISVNSQTMNNGDPYEYITICFGFIHDKSRKHCMPKQLVAPRVLRSSLPPNRSPAARRTSATRRGRCRTTAPRPASRHRDPDRVGCDPVPFSSGAAAGSLSRLIPAVYSMGIGNRIGLPTDVKPAHGTLWKLPHGSQTGNENHQNTREPSKSNYLNHT